MQSGAESPLVFVTLGMDHHRFDRLVDWVDAWLERPAPPRRCLVQRGPSRPSRLAASLEHLTYGQMDEMFASAALVVGHGGPGTLDGALSHGKRPLLVPRRKHLGEAVDDHQRSFAQRLAREGAAVVAESAEEFLRLAPALLAASHATPPARGGDPTPAIMRFEAFVQELFT